MKTIALELAVVAALLLVSSTALADAPPPLTGGAGSPDINRLDAPRDHAVTPPVTIATPR